MNRAVVLFAALLSAPSAFAQSHGTSQAAVRALDEGTLRLRSSQAIDLDRDGDVDELFEVENGAGYRHCVAAMRTAAARWTAFALTGLGGDHAGRCVAARDGLVVVAWIGSNPHEPPPSWGAVDIELVAVTEAGKRSLQSIDAGEPGARAWEQLAVQWTSREIIVTAPRMRRVRLRRPR
jgi:hypothetical protein